VHATTSPRLRARAAHFRKSLINNLMSSRKIGKKKKREEEEKRKKEEPNGHAKSSPPLRCNSSPTKRSYPRRRPAT